mmetsp:Transcript_37409/g.81627  ORF Transcript_37409/g.81627 Transcript_37409/m.81627 type:complete len:241 (-) Transcript_37409:12-734(-)
MRRAFGCWPACRPSENSRACTGTAGQRGCNCDPGCTHWGAARGRCGPLATAARRSPGGSTNQSCSRDQAHRGIRPSTAHWCPGPRKCRQCTSGLHTGRLRAGCSRRSAGQPKPLVGRCPDGNPKAPRCRTGGRGGRWHPREGAYRSLPHKSSHKAGSSRTSSNRESPSFRTARRPHCPQYLCSTMSSHSQTYPLASTGGLGTRSLPPTPPAPAADLGPSREPRARRRDEAVSFWPLRPAP